MSTKAIRDALDGAQDYLIEPTAGNRRLWELIDAARVELEAIEQAATVLHTGATTPAGWDTPGVHDAFDMMSRIAEEAP